MSVLIIGVLRQFKREDKLAGTLEASGETCPPWSQAACLLEPVNSLPGKAGALLSFPLVMIINDLGTGRG